MATRISSHLVAGIVRMFCLVLISGYASAQQSSFVSHVWVADNGDGTYKNPIIYSDYSDPDVIRVGNDFYMTASSFNAVPGLPILHSNDLVNWQVINYAIRRLEPEDVYSKPQHGNGIWAPAVRFHNGEYFIYYADPDFGLFVTKAKDPAGKWSKPVRINNEKGWIDPCPLWDNNGNAYLVHAFAGSRAGIKSVLVVNKMNNEGTKVLDKGVIIFDGHDADHTVEGPKFYKQFGWYYILAPAGGVSSGWQLALRSKSVYGPYEKKVVLAQGKSPVNGPHQGALVDTQTGEWWFLHFNDKGAYGRVVDLEPVAWTTGFPTIGNGGEPVLTFKKPNVGKSYPVQTPQDSDEFNGNQLGPQWQWHANEPQAPWGMPVPDQGVFRMFSVEVPTGFKNLWDSPNLLLQKFPAEEFTATAKVKLDPRFEGEKFGFLVMGTDYSYIGATYKGGSLYIAQATDHDADKGLAEYENLPFLLKARDFYLRVKVSTGASCSFSFSLDGKTFTNVGVPFKAREGKWIGAKIGFFFNRTGKFNDAGSADIDWIRFEKNS